MPKRARSKKATQAAAEERAMKRIDRAVARYGAGAVAKYYSPATRMRPEMKYFDTSYNGVSLSTANDWSTSVLTASNYIASDGSTITAYSLAPIIPSAVGSSYGQVVGNKYMIRKIKVRGFLRPDPTDGASANIGVDCRSRLIMLMDKQPSGVQAQPTDIFTDWGSNFNNLDSFQAVGTAGMARYRVLYDRTFVHHVEAVNSGSGDSAFSAVPIKISKTFKKGIVVNIRSNSSVPAMASLYDCNIYLVGLTYNESAGAAGAVKLYATARCCYTD